MKVGDCVTIKGEIEFWQDFSLCRGSFPPDQVFEVTQFMHQGRTAELVGSGYGDLKEEDNYGNGSIFVYERNYSQLIPYKTNRYGILKRTHA